MKKIIKLMSISLALCGCVALNSCKDSNSNYIDSSYNEGDNKTMSKILEEISASNSSIDEESKFKGFEYNKFNSVKQYSNSNVILNDAAFKETTTDGVSYFKFSDLNEIDVTGAEVVTKTDDYGNSYVYTIKKTDKTFDGSVYVNYQQVTNAPIYKCTLYGHITNDGIFDFVVDFYTTNNSKSYIETICYINQTLYIGAINYNSYMSFNENMNENNSSFRQLSKPKKELVTIDADDEDDIDYEKMYKYAGYTYDEDINQYIKVVNSGNYNIVYHKNEKGKDLSEVVYHKNAYTNKTVYIWQEDVIIAEKSKAKYTYFDGDGEKHLVKTYYSNLADGTSCKEIETEIVFNDCKALTDNYLVLTGYEVDDDEEILDNKLRTYFLKNSGKVVYRTILNLDYSQTIKLKDNVYMIGDDLYDGNLNYIDTVSYSSGLNAFVSTLDDVKTIYDIAGNAIATGSYSVVNGAIYDDVNKKYYSLLDNKLVEYSGTYYGDNTYYNLDISVTKSGDVYKYDVKSLDGKVSTTFYSENSNLSFSYTKYTSRVRLTANSTIYADQAKENKLGFILFNI